MKNLFHRLPTFAADYSGAANAAKRMDALVILHGQGGCIGGVLTCDDYQYDPHEMRILFSKINEVDTVIGDDERYFHRIAEALEQIPCAFVVVCSSPIPELIGTDSAAWARYIEEHLGKPAIALDTTGFDTYEVGERKLFEALVDHFAEGAAAPAGIVNIIGDTALNGWTDEMRLAFEKDLRREYREVRFWGRDVGLAELRELGKAERNIAVSASALSTVKKLKEKFGTPYSAGYFIGDAETQNIADDGEKESGTGGKESPSVLLLGEQVMMNSLRDCFRRDFGIKAVSVASFFQMEEELCLPGDQKFSGEWDYADYLEQHGPFDIIVGDAALQDLGGYVRGFACLPQFSVASTKGTERIPNIYGSAGHDFLRRIFEGSAF